MSDPTEPRSLPDDVLGRLKNIIEACTGWGPTPTVVELTVQADLTVLRDAVAEIERRRAIEAGLRRSLYRALELVRIAREATGSQADPPKPELGPDAATGCADDQTFAHLTPEQIRDTAEHMGILFPYGAPRPERWEIDSLVRDVSSAGKIEWPSEPFAVTPMPTPCSVRIWFRRRVPG